MAISRMQNRVPGLGECHLSGKRSARQVLLARDFCRPGDLSSGFRRGNRSSVPVDASVTIPALSLTESDALSRFLHPSSPTRSEPDGRTMAPSGGEGGTGRGPCPRWFVRAGQQGRRPRSVELSGEVPAVQARPIAAPGFAVGQRRNAGSQWWVR